jgi:transcriptional regulator with XRE-family HTH domain
MVENIIVIILKEFDLSQSKLAELLFTSRQNVSRWVNGDSIADEYKIRLSKLTGIPINYFIKGIDVNADIVEKFVQNKKHRVSERIRIIKRKGDEYYKDSENYGIYNNYLTNQNIREEKLDIINTVINDCGSKKSFELIIKSLQVYSMRKELKYFNKEEIKEIKKIIQICLDIDSYSNKDRIIKQFMED